MNELTLTTPALLFSAISLLLLAYTNRFLAYANVVRSLHARFKDNRDTLLIGQIKNLRKRLVLTRTMQLLGIGSLLLCVPVPEQSSSPAVGDFFDIWTSWTTGDGQTALAGRTISEVPESLGPPKPDHNIRSITRRMET